jgi:hypothetical protein
MSNTASQKYKGTINTTISGLPCQRWVDNYPHQHFYRDNYAYPDNNVTDAQNYCRDPNKKGYIWCFTLDPIVRSERCLYEGKQSWPPPTFSQGT